jgi:hypothetical protein
MQVEKAVRVFSGASCIRPRWPIIFGSEIVVCEKEYGTSMPMKNSVRINVTQEDDFIKNAFCYGYVVLFPSLAK